MNERYDVVIVGAGIAGISAAIYLKRSSLSFCLLERGAPGGKLNTIHRIDNYPGLPRISGLEFSISLQKQLSDLGGKIDYGNIVEATKSDGGFALRLDSGKTVYCSSIICASGSSERKLGIPGEKEFFGKGVSYCATCDGAFFRGQDVLVYGYKDFAAEDALYLSSICRKVYFGSSALAQTSRSSKASWKALAAIPGSPMPFWRIQGGLRYPGPSPYSSKRPAPPFYPLCPSRRKKGSSWSMRICKVASKASMPAATS